MNMSLQSVAVRGGVEKIEEEKTEEKKEQELKKKKNRRFGVHN